MLAEKESALHLLSLQHDALLVKNDRLQEVACNLKLDNGVLCHQADRAASIANTEICRLRSALSEKNNDLISQVSENIKRLELIQELQNKNFKLKSQQNCYLEEIRELKERLSQIESSRPYTLFGSSPYEDDSTAVCDDLARYSR